MILEYLFSEPISVKDKIKSYAKTCDSVNIEIKNVKDTDVWLVSFKVDSEDDNSALILSKVNQDIIENYNVTILTNEAPFYYNKMLYPLINKFERDLRKLLYLASKLSKDSSKKKIIFDLEKMDFGNLFDLIFTDTEFINKVKAKVNTKSWNYSKDEIINDLKEIEENTLWIKLLGLKIAPTLQKNYIKIKSYRNSVMHAHNIITEDYSCANKMYLTVIQELEDAIDNIINNKIIFENIRDFNDTIVLAIDDEIMSNLRDSMSTYTELLKGINIPDLKLSTVLSQYYPFVTSKQRYENYLVDLGLSNSLVLTKSDIFDALFSTVTNLVEIGLWGSLGPNANQYDIKVAAECFADFIYHNTRE